MARSLAKIDRKQPTGPAYTLVVEDDKPLRMTREGLPALVIVKRSADGTEHLAREGERDAKDREGNAVLHADGPDKGKPVRETTYKPTSDLADLADAFAPGGVLAPCRPGGGGAGPGRQAPPRPARAPFFSRARGRPAHPNRTAFPANASTHAMLAPATNERTEEHIEGPAAFRGRGPARDAGARHRDHAARAAVRAPLVSRSLAAVRARPRVSVQPAGSQHASYELDVDAIRTACEQLGLTRPVVIGFSLSARWDGLYTPNGGAHRVSVNALGSGMAASRTLWHELEHARQHESGERDPAGTTHLRGRAYRDHPNEVAARRRESMHLILPLAYDV